MRRAAPLLLLLVLLAPGAAADHVYSHRYVIFGRVLDANGNPLPNVTMTFGYSNISPQGECGYQPGTETDAWGPTKSEPLTNALGEFMFCLHTHIITPEAHAEGLLTSDLGTRTEFPLDPDLRASYVVVHVPEALSRARAGALDEVATVAGRGWRYGQQLVENIPVNGTTANLEPVKIAFHHDGVTDVLNTTTNRYGDFATRIPLMAPVRNGTVEVTMENQTYVSAYDQADGIAYMKLNLSERAPFPVETAPGSVPDFRVTSLAPQALAAPADAPRRAPGLEPALALVALALVARAYTRGGA